MGERYARPFDHPPNRIVNESRANPGESGESNRTVAGVAPSLNADSWTCTAVLLHAAADLVRGGSPVRVAARAKGVKDSTLRRHLARAG